MPTISPHSLSLLDCLVVSGSSFLSGNSSSCASSSSSSDQAVGTSSQLKLLGPRILPFPLSHVQHVFSNRVVPTPYLRFRAPCSGNASAASLDPTAIFGGRCNNV